MSRSVHRLVVQLLHSCSILLESLYVNFTFILIPGQFWLHPRAMQAQQADIVDTHLVELFKLCAQLEHRFIRLSQAQLKQIRLLKLVNNS